MKPSAFVAFLRGINVGGNALIKMTELKKTFESLGFKEVIPVLASGNVVFETPRVDPVVIKGRIEQMLHKQFNLKAVAILRSQSQILHLLKSNPFQGSKVPSDTKIQITFLGEETNATTKFPIRLPIEEFEIVQVSRREVFSVVDLSSDSRTPDLMKILERHFGKNLTTRTWNTVEKIGKLLQGGMSGGLLRLPHGDTT